MLRRIAWMVFAVMGVEGLAATASPAAKITLTAKDRKLLADKGCGAAGLDTATARPGGASRVAASVRCRAHGTDAQNPVARVSQCQKKGGAWTCAPPRDALLLMMPDDSMLAVVSEGVPVAEVVQTVNYVAGLSVPPFQNGAIEVLQDECTLRQLPERAFRGATHFTLECTGGTLAVTRDCWDKRCRFFITNAKKRD